MITFLKGVGRLKLRNRKTRFKSCKGKDSLKGPGTGDWGRGITTFGSSAWGSPPFPTWWEEGKCSGIQKAGAPTPVQCIPSAYLGKLLDLHQGRGSKLLQKNEEDYPGAGKINPDNSPTF